MKKEIRGNIKKAISLILSAALAMSMNMTIMADEEIVEFEENPIVVEEFDAGSEYAEDSQDDIIIENEIEEDDVLEELEPQTSETGEGDIVEIEDENVTDDDALIEDEAAIEEEISEDENTLPEITEDTDGALAGNELVIRDQKAPQVFSFPENLDKQSIVKLSIIDCDVSAKIDFSGFDNLEELVFTGNKGTDEATNYAVKFDGFNTLKKLRKTTFDNSTIESLEFAAAPTNDGNLIFSAVECANLNNLRFGGYTLVNGYDADDNQYAPSFRGCSALDYLDVKGIADQERQVFDINGCVSLGYVNINYNFTNREEISEENLYETNILVIDGGNIRESSGELNLSIKSGSQPGKYVVRAFDESFLFNNKKEDIAIYEELDTSLQFIIFEQEKSKFESQDLWMDNKSTYRRDYEANPIIIRQGETIKKNRPYFYSKSGYKIEDERKLKVYVKNLQAIDSSHQVIEVEGLSTIGTEHAQYGKQLLPSEGSDGKISTNDIISDLKVTGKSAGVAMLTVEASDGDSSMPRSQIIIVAASVQSMALAEGLPTNYEAAGEYPIGTQMTVYEDSKELVNNAFGSFTWDVYRWNRNTEKWEDFENYTAAGLQVTSDASKNKTGVWPKDVKGTPVSNPGDKYDASISKGVIVNTSKLTIGQGFAGGKIKLVAHTLDNYGPDEAHSGGDYRGIYSFSKDHYIKSGEYVFTIMTVGQSTTKIQYKKAETSGTIPESVTFERPDMGEGYQIDADFTANKDIIGDNLVWEKPDGDTGRTIKLAFNKSKSSAQIADFLKKLNSRDSDCKVTVEISVTDTNTGTTSNYPKTVKLSGLFKVTYDAKGGTVTKKNVTKYSIPTASADVPGLMLNGATKKGYTFVEWRSGSNKVTKLTEGALGDLSLVAYWTANKYTNTLKYNANGGTKAPTAQTATVTYPDTQKTFTLTTAKPTPYAKKGYTVTFTGWYTEKSGGTKVGSTYTVGAKNKDANQSVTLYARWKETANKYTTTLKYNANGGSKAPAAQTATVTYPNTQKSFTLSTTKPTPYAKKGYTVTFTGWYTEKTGGTKVGSKYTAGVNNKDANQTITLYAHWKETANKYTNTLKYDANGGSGAPAKQTASVTYPSTQKKFTVSTVKPKRNGYVFVGWYTKKTDGSKVGTTIVVGDKNATKGQTVTLYARWKKK